MSTLISIVIQTNVHFESLHLLVKSISIAAQVSFSSCSSLFLFRSRSVSFPVQGLFPLLSKSVTTVQINIHCCSSLFPLLSKSVSLMVQVSFHCCSSLFPLLSESICFPDRVSFRCCSSPFLLLSESVSLPVQVSFPSCLS